MRTAAQWGWGALWHLLTMGLPTEAPRSTAFCTSWHTHSAHPAGCQGFGPQSDHWVAALVPVVTVEPFAFRNFRPDQKCQLMTSETLNSFIKASIGPWTFIVPFEYENEPVVSFLHWVNPPGLSSGHVSSRPPEIQVEYCEVNTFSCLWSCYSWFVCLPQMLLHQRVCLSDTETSLHSQQPSGSWLTSGTIMQKKQFFIIDKM